MKSLESVFIVLCCMFLPGAPAMAQPMKVQITGLFMPEREHDLRDAAAKMPDVKLIGIDYKNAEAAFDLDLATFGKPAQAITKLDALLKKASSNTFGVKPLRRMPLEKLKLIEIPVVGLDCKACCLAAYESIYKLDGVERATASFREGRVTAHVDPAKTNRATLEGALKKKGVRLKTP